MKRIITFCLAVIMTLSMVTQIAAAYNYNFGQDFLYDDTFVLGDVNNDGSINSVDSYCLRITIAGAADVEINGQSADFDANGQISAPDSYSLKLCMAGVKCAVSEAVTNCTVHAYKDTVGPVTMTMRSYNDRSVRIEIKDRGIGIEDIQSALQPLYTTDREGERSGMGFTVMESFTDKLRVTSRLGKGTKITLIKALSDISPAT